MIDEITERPSGASEHLSREMTMGSTEAEQPARSLSAMTQAAAQGRACAHCGALNEPEAVFCASCGSPMGMVSCPNCGAEIDADADFCETCHHYIRTDVCSFCGAAVTSHDAYCPECGSPRGGIVCPTCNTLNDFSFCKQCGSALTEEARVLMAELQKTPEYKEMERLSAELQKLDMILPLASERDVQREVANNQLRQRVLMLLARDMGTEPSQTGDGVLGDGLPRGSKRLPKEELDRQREERLAQLSALLEKLAQPAQPQPAKVRNYAMACKPQGVRLAWECNFKHALHSSPCGCAKPQMGGKWLVLGKNTKKEIKDDQ